MVLLYHLTIPGVKCFLHFDMTMEVVQKNSGVSFPKRPRDDQIISVLTLPPKKYCDNAGHRLLIDRRPRRDPGHQCHIQTARGECPAVIGGGRLVDTGSGHYPEYPFQVALKTLKDDRLNA